MAIMTIEGKEYEIDTMTDEQKEIINKLNEEDNFKIN